MKSLIKTTGLTIGYKGKTITADVNLSLQQGSLTALIGCNGAGKSTLLKTLTGNIKPIKGKIELGTKELTEINRKELSKLLAVVTTEQPSAGGLTLQELVAMGRIPYTGRIGRLNSEDKQIVKEALIKVGIEHKKDTFVADLSDGERQKGMIARALAQQTPLIIMDEPFSFLDVASRLELLDLMRELVDEQNKTILFSTHEVGEAMRIADNLWAFVKDDKGTTIIEGTSEQLIQTSVIDRLFGESRVRYDRLKGIFELKK